jgi:hypothetical protein
MGKAYHVLLCNLLISISTMLNLRALTSAIPFCYTTAAGLLRSFIALRDAVTSGRGKNTSYQKPSAQSLSLAMINSITPLLQCSSWLFLF